MRLNADYIRDILLFIEKEFEYEDAAITPPYRHKTMLNSTLVLQPHFHHHCHQELIYALELLIIEGYISTASEPKIINGNLQNIKITGLTYKGHELLDNIRNNTVWNAVKKKAASFGGFSFSTLVSGAKYLGDKLISDPNAIDNFLKGVDRLTQLF